VRYARYSPPLPEALPDHNCWAALLWPWLDRIDDVAPGCAVVARSLAYAVDGRDNTVDTERCRVTSRGRQREVVAELVALGLLESSNPGRHRVVLPPDPLARRQGRTRR
jgi:hypothetical protein